MWMSTTFFKFLINIFSVPFLSLNQLLPNLLSYLLYTSVHVAATDVSERHILAANKVDKLIVNIVLDKIREEMQMVNMIKNTIVNRSHRFEVDISGCSGAKAFGGRLI